MRNGTVGISNRVNEKIEAEQVKTNVANWI